MKYLLTLALIGLSVAVGSELTVTLVSPQPQQPQTKQPPINPAIDMQGYLKVSQTAAEHREKRRVTEEQFIAMSKEKGTIILDARSKEKFDLMHIKGAINLSFPDIDIDSLAKTLPDKNVRILIYCNNNFDIKGAKPELARAFATKRPTASLNLSTFIALYNYGYHNVYELAPFVDPAKTKLDLIGTGK